MNLSKIHGTFPSYESLYCRIVHECLQYDHPSTIDMSDALLVYSDLSIVLHEFQGILAVSVASRTALIPPCLTQLPAACIFNTSVAFPLVVKEGTFKDIVDKANLSEFIARLKSLTVQITSLSQDPSHLSKPQLCSQMPSPSQHQEPGSSVQDAVRPNPEPQRTHPQSAQPHPDFTSRPPAASVGHVDLDPVAASPGLLPYSSGVPASSGGGMFVGPEHPLFNPPRAGQPSDPFTPTLPMGAVPPGARFDPISPFGPQPGFAARPSNAFAPQGQIPGRRSNQPFR